MATGALVDGQIDTNDTSSPVKTPLPTPDNTAHPPPPREYTSDQLGKYATVLEKVSSWTELPTSTSQNASSTNSGSKDNNRAPITDSERMWLTRECLFRYLRATKWNPIEAERRLRATLIWRREYMLPEHDADYVSPENESGKQVIVGYDKNCAPCHYLLPAKQNSARSERQIQHLVYMLERVIDLMPAGQEALALLIKFATGGGKGAGSGPNIAQGRQVLYILQNHYPERLEKALISEVPWYIATFFKLISPLIDPVTKSKMVFNEPFAKYVPSNQLLQQFGGSLDFTYDHSEYWPALIKLCADRRESQRKRWEESGKRIGEFEAYLRGGGQKPLKEAEKATQNI